MTHEYAAAGKVMMADWSGLKHLNVALACTLAVVAPMLVGCAAAQTNTAIDTQGGAEEAVSNATPVLQDCAVSRDTSFGGVYLDVTIDEFNDLGFSFGDKVDVVFSNGYQMSGIPYFNGYYVRVGNPLVVGYPGYPYVEVSVNYGDPLWDTAGLSEGDTATVTLVERGAFRDVQESFDITYANDRSEYKHETDEQFANFRPLSGGTLRQGRVYRSASPVDNEYGRASYVEDLMKQNGVGYVLNLSDNPDEIDAFLAEDDQAGIDVSYFRQLQNRGCVGTLELSVSYPSPSFAKKLSEGLIEMSRHEGPYLVHCIEGKDRTGFVCALLEALCGASYDEMVIDYMATYENYYGITKQGDSTKYDAIVHLNLDGMLAFLAGADDGTDLSSIDYAPFARQYLKNGGMTDEQVDALIARISE